MSWDIYLVDDSGFKVRVDHHEGEGGMYAVGGSNKAELNVTYNYGKHFDFKSLHGRKAGDTIREMINAILALGTKRDPDYWNPTPGNVGHALTILANWSVQHPDAAWHVS